MANENIEFKTNVRSMDSDGRTWFATAVIGSVLADGLIAHAETQFLLQVARLVSNSHTLNYLKSCIQEHTVPDLAHPLDFSRKDAMCIVVDLVRIASSDGEFHPKEKAYIMRVAKMLKFDSDDTTKLIQFGLQLSLQEQDAAKRGT